MQSQRMSFMFPTLMRQPFKVLYPLLLLTLFASLWIGPRSAVQATMAQTPILSCNTGVFSDTARRGDISLADDRSVLRARIVDVDFDLLAQSTGPQGSPSGAGAFVLLNLFRDTCYTAVLEHAAGEPPTKFTWMGRVKGVPGSQVTLVVENAVMAASITVPGRVFQVRYLGNGVHAVVEIDQRAFPPD